MYDFGNGRPYLSVVQPKVSPSGPATSPFDDIRRLDEQGEYWSARELMVLCGYTKWSNFERCVLSARVAIEQEEGIDAAQDHIADVGNLGATGLPGVNRTLSDHRLTRHGAYMTVLECDGTKPEIAAAKTYFARMTREAEVAQEARALQPVTTQLSLDTYEGRMRLLQMAMEAEQRAETERHGRMLAEARSVELEEEIEVYHQVFSTTGWMPIAELASHVQIWKLYHRPAKGPYDRLGQILGPQMICDALRGMRILMESPRNKPYSGWTRSGKMRYCPRAWDGTETWQPSRTFTGKRDEIAQTYPVPWINGRHLDDLIRMFERDGFMVVPDGQERSIELYYGKFPELRP